MGTTSPTALELACLDNIVVILVATTHPGNIGAAARAMKTMGLSRLRLVNPARFPAVEATVRASGADDVLQGAELYPSLRAAVSDCALVVGTTARLRSLSWPIRDPRTSAAEFVPVSLHSRVALVFGREHAGLTNDEVEFCQQLVRIPTAEDFSSLNVAAAVQILVYEARLAALSVKQEEYLVSEPEDALATGDQLEQFYAHLEQAMTLVGFFDPQKPRRLLRRLRRLFNRTEMRVTELNILRGFCAAVTSLAAKDGSDDSVG